MRHIITDILAVILGTVFEMQAVILPDIACFSWF